MASQAPRGIRPASGSCAPSQKRWARHHRVRFSLLLSVLATLTVLSLFGPPPASGQDQAWRISMSPTTVGEGSSATVTVTFETADGAPTTEASEFTVNVYGDPPLGAAEGIDYADVADFTITIPAGTRSGGGTFTLTPIDDEEAEGTEAIQVRVTRPAPRGSYYLSYRGVIALVDNEPADGVCGRSEHVRRAILDQTSRSSCASVTSADLEMVTTFELSGEYRRTHLPQNESDFDGLTKLETLTMTKREISWLPDLSDLTRAPGNRRHME